MKTVVLILMLLTTVSGFAENAEMASFWVVFSDKSHSIYSINQPAEFLSDRAIERRQKQNIPIKENDFPVNLNYLNQLKNQGAIIKFTSRWFNAAAVACTKENVQQIAKLPFVKSVEYVGKHFRNAKTLQQKKGKPKTIKRAFLNKYGYAKTQIEMLKGVRLHELGLTGYGQMIAVLDAGFTDVGSSIFFEESRQKNRLLHAYDIIESDTDVYESSKHGTQVLSVMAANIPGVMVGTAPDAIYVCIKTEDIRGEFRTDECAWVRGLEYADSLGVDVVNSSLGYTIFDDGEMDYQQEDLDGKTSLTSQAAEVAFSKGMIVVNSAGNEGKNDWKGLAMPADGPNVLAIGAVNQDNQKCDFSSIGWVSNRGVKPDLVALGIDVAVVSGEKAIVLSGQGTSYAAPLVSGLVATLWQAYPYATNQQIMEAIRKTANSALHPNQETGFGVPNFSAAFNYLEMKEK